MSEVVYMLMQGARAVYVGRTKNIDNRLREHRADGKVFDTHNVVITDAAADLELYLIRSLKPYYNYGYAYLYAIEEVDLPARRPPPRMPPVRVRRGERRGHALSEEELSKAMADLEREYDLIKASQA